MYTETVMITIIIFILHPIIIDHLGPCFTFPFLATNLDKLTVIDKIFFIHYLMIASLTILFIHYPISLSILSLLSQGFLFPNSHDCCFLVLIKKSCPGRNLPKKNHKNFLFIILCFGTE